MAEYIDVGITSRSNGKYGVNGLAKYFNPQIKPNARIEYFVPEIKKVIFNDPATIIIWLDGYKTIVKVHDEPYDKEKGFAMCVLKRLYGDFYHRTLKEVLKDDQD